MVGNLLGKEVKNIGRREESPGGEESQTRSKTRGDEEERKDWPAVLVSSENRCSGKDGRFCLIRKKSEEGRLE